MAEERVFGICDYFNKKSVLETAITGNQGYFPFITAIIPTWNRGESLVECLTRCFPRTTLQTTSRSSSSMTDRGMRRRNLRVPSPACFLATRRAAANLTAATSARGTRKAKFWRFWTTTVSRGGSWLKDLVPYLQWEKVGSVGGYVDGYSDRSALDRYEKEFSLLNLGRYIQRGANDGSTFYVPTCNLLVRKEAFFETGGIRETLHLGEDVDFCWRMRDAGWQALYVPSGTVKHKHRKHARSDAAEKGGLRELRGGALRSSPAETEDAADEARAAAAFLGICLSIVFSDSLTARCDGGVLRGGSSGKSAQPPQETCWNSRPKDIVIRPADLRVLFLYPVIPPDPVLPRPSAPARLCFSPPLVSRICFAAVHCIRRLFREAPPPLLSPLPFVLHS